MRGATTQILSLSAAGPFRMALAVTACATPSLIMVDRAGAETYFCSPAPVDVGSYRPADSSSDLAITVTVPGAAPFWFDDITGDYVPFVDGVAGQLERGKVHIPPDLRRPGGPVDRLVAFAVTAEQCRPSPLGVVPSSDASQP